MFARERPASDPNPGRDDRDRDDRPHPPIDREDDAPETPPTEPEPVPVEDPPDSPAKRGPYTV